MSKTVNIDITKDAQSRILEIQSKEENKGKFLRISILGGGCSGFQYNFKLDDNINDKDLKIEHENKILVAIDKTSLEFLKDCSLDYVNDLGGSFFKITNPNATASCGCGASFSV